MTELIRRIHNPSRDSASYASREWIVTNGLGGYASGTVSGIVTRRYHGLLVAALPAPTGRMVMLSHLDAQLRLASDRLVRVEPQPWPDLVGPQRSETLDTLPLVEFRLELGLPVWRFEGDGFVVEKRILMPHGQNTVHVTYRVLQAPVAARLELRPFLHVRHYESPLREALPNDYVLSDVDGHVEVAPGGDLPTLRLLFFGSSSSLTVEGAQLPHGYLLEQARGYEYRGALWSPGYFQAPLGQPPASVDATLVASTESWGVIEALTPGAIETMLMKGLVLL